MTGPADASVVPLLTANVAMTAKADTRTKNLVGNIRTLPADRSRGGKSGMATKRVSTARPTALQPLRARSWHNVNVLSTGSYSVVIEKSCITVSTAHSGKKIF